jgi:hypothetical protein
MHGASQRPHEPNVVAYSVVAWGAGGGVTEVVRFARLSTVFFSKSLSLCSFLHSAGTSSSSTGC